MSEDFMASRGDTASPGEARVWLTLEVSAPGSSSSGSAPGSHGQAQTEQPSRGNRPTLTLSVARRGGGAPRPTGESNTRRRTLRSHA